MDKAIEYAKPGFVKMCTKHLDHVEKRLQQEINRGKKSLSIQNEGVSKENFNCGKSLGALIYNISEDTSRTRSSAGLLVAFSVYNNF